MTMGIGMSMRLFDKNQSSFFQIFFYIPLSLFQIKPSDNFRSAIVEVSRLIQKWNHWQIILDTDIIVILPMHRSDMNNTSAIFRGYKICQNNIVIFFIGIFYRRSFIKRFVFQVKQIFAFKFLRNFISFF